jgi:hypothetical protein
MSKFKFQAPPVIIYDANSTQQPGFIFTLNSVSSRFDHILNE